MNICALATGRGGAIAIIRVSGSDSIAIVNKHFQPATTGNALLNARTQTLHYGHFLSVPCDSVAGQPPVLNQEPPVLGDYFAEQEPIDEVLISIFRAPHSYTGENAAEISCHASPYIIQQILQSLCHSGCRMALPGEFTKRAFLNGKLDLSQAEAVADLIAAESQSQHKVAINHLRGGITTRLSQLRARLLELTALLELELDFSDHEDLEFADRRQLVDLAQETAAHINNLSATYKQGMAIVAGIPVAIVGKTNVGKSTLLNALLGDDRAIVSDIHGTTRDTVEDTLTIDGHLFRIIDTAGMRQTDDIVEQAGIERSMRKLAQASIVLWVVDTQPAPDETAEMERQCTGKVLLPLWNKCDVTPAPPHFMAISAKDGHNLESVRQALVQCADTTDNGSDIIITNARHHAALVDAQEALNRSIETMTAGLSGDLIAEDLRLCIAHIGSILGDTIENQETLNTIFSRFCIGK